ncbi:hypothetical protein [Roseateles sp. LKC17W]|uniref:Uncharacterized protein n=1 Tax=Pelomonas margarita TaxID=3299031 RepID=A0ABW7FLS9_9BURK
MILLDAPQDKRRDDLVVIANSVRDLDDLVQLFLQRLAPLKHGQRQALDQLAEGQKKFAGTH